jgi:hypothetical protein
MPQECVKGAAPQPKKQVGREPSRMLALGPHYSRWVLLPKGSILHHLDLSLCLARISQAWVGRHSPGGQCGLVAKSEKQASPFLSTGLSWRQGKLNPRGLRDGGQISSISQSPTMLASGALWPLKWGTRISRIPTKEPKKQWLEKPDQVRGRGKALSW